MSLGRAGTRRENRTGRKVRTWHQCSVGCKGCTIPVRRLSSAPGRLVQFHPILASHPPPLECPTHIRYSLLPPVASTTAATAPSQPPEPHPRTRSEDQRRAAERSRGRRVWCSERLIQPRRCTCQPRVSVGSALCPWLGEHEGAIALSAPGHRAQPSRASSVKAWHLASPPSNTPRFSTMLPVGTPTSRAMTGHLVCSKKKIPFLSVLNVS
jgi:hypothetical protein